MAPNNVQEVVAVRFRSSGRVKLRILVLSPISMNRTFLVILATTCLVGCSREYDGKTLLLDWKDSGKKVTFRVTEAPGAIVKQNTRLHVERDGSERVILIDDDAIFSTITFVRHDHWLLVVCRGVDEVLAGINHDTGQLYGEYDWERLPFMRWSGEGKVVAEQKTTRPERVARKLPAGTSGPPLTSQVYFI